MKKIKIIFDKLFSFQFFNIVGVCALILFSSSIFSVSAQEKGQAFNVSGIVTDAKDETPIIAVNVKIKGKRFGTVTDLKGQYSIKLEKGDVLVFSYLGYIPVEEVVKNAVLNVKLEESSTTLGNVEVKAGYGSVKKRDILGSVVSVSNDLIEKRMPVNIYDALQGAAAGVQINTASGAPGEPASIRIRGVSTLSDGGVNPLYIVDGMTMDDISSINPNDIKSIEILKDAASASIYGSRSANGVIIVTTKLGTENKPKFDVRYLNSYSTLAHKLPQSNAFNRRIWQNLTKYGVQWTALDSLSLSKNSDNDYQDLLTRTAVRNQLDLTISGGTKELKYFSSVQMYSEQGIILNSWLNRITARFNIDYKPSQKWSMSTRLNLGNTSRNVVDEGTTLQMALKRPAEFILNYPDGSYAYNMAGQLNPMAQANLIQNNQGAYNLALLQSFDFNLNSDFVLHIDGSGKFDVLQNKYFTPAVLSTALPPYAYGRENMGLNYNLAGNAYLTFKKSINKIHNIEAVLGTTVEYWNTYNIGFEGKGYATEAVTTANSINQFIGSGTNSYAEEHSMAGFFFRGRYDYKGRYLISGTVRRDGSSRFGSNNRWGTFPSLSAGWRFSDESFFSWAKPALDDAKLRVGWGITGNERIGNYASQLQYLVGGYAYNSVSGLAISNNLANPDLKWEQTDQKDFGLDLTFLNGRISFVGDYYIKNTTNLLYSMPMPLEIGSANTWMNVGAIQNNGLELSIKAVPIKTKDFTWNTNINYSKNNNMITDLAGVDFANDIWWVGKGFPAGTFFGYKYLGVYAYNESNAWTSDFKTHLTPVFQKDDQGNVLVGKNLQPLFMGYTLPDGTAYTGTISKKTTNGVVSMGGDIIWAEVADKNGNIDGDVSSNDRQILGSGQPKWNGAWSNDLTYKKFNLSFMFVGTFGNMIYNEFARVRNNQTSTSTSTPTPFAVMNTWKYPGQETPMNTLMNAAADNMRSNSSYYLEDGSFIRLQNVKFGYSFNTKWIKKLYLTSLDVYCYASNLAIWTNYSGYDPNVAQNSVLTPGKDTGRYPFKREFGFGINIKL